MIEPVLAIASQSTSGVILKELMVRASNAVDQYQNLAEPRCDNSIEDKRVECLRKLSEVRHSATLYHCDREFRQRALCSIYEQTINAYEATNSRSLDIVTAEVTHIESALAADKDEMQQVRRLRRRAVYFSLFSFIGIGAFIGYAHWTGMSGQNALPFLGVPACVIFWSALGGFAAILYRFTNAGDRDLEDPGRWLFSRPVTGIIMGAIAYLVVKAGLLVSGQPGVQLAAGSTPATNEVMWLIAFLAGFSDRFSETTLRSLIGRFGGKSDELLNLDIGKSITAADLLPPVRSRKVTGDEVLSGHQTAEHIGRNQSTLEPLKSSENGGRPVAVSKG